MSKPVTRIVFSVLISLLVIAAVYTSVLGAPLGAERTGHYLVSGAKVNLDHYRLSAPYQSSLGALDSLTTHTEGVHGCGGDEHISSPDD